MAAVGPAGGLGRGLGADDDLPPGLCRGQPGQVDAQVGAGHGEAALAVLQVGRGGFECLCRQLLRLGQGLFAGHAHGRAAGEQRPAAGAAKAVGLVGVALLHADAPGRQPEHVHRQLHVAGGDALAHGHGGAGELDEAVVGERHADALGQCAAAGPLQEGGQAAPAQQAAGGRAGAACLEAGPVGQRQALVHQRLEVAAVVDLPERVGVGQLRRADEVAAPQLGRVQAQAARGRVHQPLDQVDGLGPPGAAVGAGGRVVGEHGRDADVHRADVVHAGAHPGPHHQRDGHRAAARAAAHVGVGVHAQREHAAVGIERQLGMAGLAAAVHGGQELLHALGLPLDGPRGLQRGPGDGDVLGVGAGLHAEAAAHVAHRHAHGLGAQAGQAGHQRAAQAGGHLRARAQHEPAFVEPGVEAARLQCRGRQALVLDLERHHMGSGAKGRGAGGGVAVAGLGEHVAGCIGPDLGRAGRQRRCQRTHRRQHLVVHRHGLRGGLGRGGRVGHHQRHRLADEPHHLVCQRTPGRRGGRAAVGPLEAGRKGHGLDARRHQVGPGEHGAHARQRPRGGGVDRDDARVGVRAAHEGRKALAGQAQVVGEAAFTAQQRGVFDAAQRVAAAEAQRAELGMGVWGVHRGSVVAAGSAAIVSGSWPVRPSGRRSAAASARRDSIA